MKLFLKVWKQEGPEDEGHFESHVLDGVSEDSSFLEMLDQLNEQLLGEGKEPIAFDHDCREGICGTCSLNINGYAHGPENSTTTCQLHMRKFEDGDSITVEPFRAKAFPVVKDLVVNRSAFDKIIQAGGFITVRTGSAPDGNAMPVPKEDADLGNGCSPVYWLRGLCGILQECICYALYFGQSRTLKYAPTRTSRKGFKGFKYGCRNGRGRVWELS